MDLSSQRNARLIGADVLVIGGGVAGMYAALKAREGGAGVLLVSKGPIGRSGGSIFAGSLVASFDTKWQFGGELEHRSAKTVGFRPSQYYYYLADESHLSRAYAFLRTDLQPELERLGLYFRRMPDGLLLHSRTHRGSWTPSMGMSGRAIGDLLRRLVFDAGIPVLEEAMATSLLVRDGRCVGATVLDIVRGELVPIRAKATILATGHANYLSRRSTGTREVCGDGIAIPYRAGAELFNLEIQEWHLSDLAWPRAWTRLHIYPNPMPATDETSRLRMPEGNVVFELKATPGATTAPYYYQHKRLYEHAVRTGQGYERYKSGGYFSDLRHIDPFILDEYSYQTQFLRKLGLDPQRDLIENAPTYHYILGGVWVDLPSMESPALPGLFAAGAAAGRLGQTICMYDGRCAAEGALRRIRALPLPEADPAAISQETERVLGPLRSAGQPGVPPMRLKNEIREVMWRKMDYVKHAAKMQSALADLAAIRRELVPAMRLSSATRRYNWEWVDALDVPNMLDACELQITASLHRQESRGTFFRADFPYHDNANWLRHILLRQGRAGPDIREEPVHTEGLELPAREDFFGTAY